MRIVISGVDGMQPVVLDGLTAFVFAGDDGRAAVPVIAHGDPKLIAGLAAVILTSVRTQLGGKAFELVVAAARKSAARVENVTDAVRGAKAMPALPRHERGDANG